MAVPKQVICTHPYRLRYMVKQLENGEVNIEELKKNLEYTASLLEAVYIDETRCDWRYWASGRDPHTEEKDTRQTQ